MFGCCLRSPSWRAWQGIIRSTNWLTQNWQRPDESIWEVRGGRREFLHSRLMCWVALDRAIRLSRKRSLPAPIVRWLEVRDAIYQEIDTEFWDPDQEAFVQSKGSSALDASCLLMPLVRFISPTDPRWLSTLKAVGEQLVDDSLVFRYSTEHGTDGLFGGEGTLKCAASVRGMLSACRRLGAGPIPVREDAGLRKPSRTFRRRARPRGRTFREISPRHSRTLPYQRRILSRPGLVRSRWPRVIPWIGGSRPRRSRPARAVCCQM